jgi:hypothetical protein
MTQDQRKALQKIRNVIPKDRASDEELMTMLLDWQNDTDKVIQHFFEAGQSAENEWAVSTNKKDARAAKRQEHQKPPRANAVGQTAAPRDKAQNNQSGNTQPRPAAARPAPNNRPAPHPAEPAAPAAPAAGSWASRIRAQQPVNLSATCLKVWLTLLLG